VPQNTRGAWASTRGCGARHATRTRVPSSAGRGGGSAAQPAPPRAVQRAVGTWRRVGRAPCRWRGGDRSSSSDDDAGAHARHMRRRTSGSCQLTLPPRPISRVSSASLPFLAASYTASPIESLITSTALDRPSPARTPAPSGVTRGSAVTLGRRRRALRRGAHAARPHTPLGARVAAAAVARGRVEDARSDHGAQSGLPQRLAPEAPSSVVWACEAAVAPKAPNVCDAGHRARRGHRARE